MVDFVEAGGGYGSGGGGPGGIHEPPISFVYNNPYIPTGKCISLETLDTHRKNSLSIKKIYQSFL